MILKFIQAEYPCTRAVKDEDAGIVRAYSGDAVIFQASKVRNFFPYILVGGDWEEKTLEERKAAKLAELSAACNAAITAGCDVTLTAGSGHIALTAEDQINLSTATAAVEQGAVGYPYHLDGQLCAVYPAADIRAMATAATAHKLYQTTYYNHLAAWVRRVETAEELAAITYGAALPQDLEDNMAAILGAANEA